MDWLSKVEEERRQKAAAEQDAIEKQRRAAEKVRASLTTIVGRLRPTLDPLVDDIERRLGLRLGVSLTSTEFTVFAPKPPKSALVHEHRVVFSRPQGGTRARVTAVSADQIHRDSEYQPADMTLAEWRGEDEVVLEGEVDVQDLLKGDLLLLTEWLVRTALSERERVPVPRIKISGRQPAAPSRPRPPDKTVRFYFKYLLPVLTMGGVVIFTGHIKELSALDWVWILLPGVNWLFLLGCLGIVPNELTSTYQVTAAALVAIGGAWAALRRMRERPT